MEAQIFNKVAFSKIRLENEELSYFLIDFIKIIPPQFYESLTLILNDSQFNISLKEFARIFKREIFSVCEKKAQRGYIKHFKGTRLQEVETIAEVLYKQEIQRLPKWVQEA